MKLRTTATLECSNIPKRRYHSHLAELETCTANSDGFLPHWGVALSWMIGWYYPGKAVRHKAMLYIFIWILFFQLSHREHIVIIEKEKRMLDAWPEWHQKCDSNIGSLPARQICCAISSIRIGIISRDDFHVERFLRFVENKFSGEISQLQNFLKTMQSRHMRINAGGIIDLVVHHLELILDASFVVLFPFLGMDEAKPSRLYHLQGQITIFNEKERNKISQWSITVSSVDLSFS